MRIIYVAIVLTMLSKINLSAQIVLTQTVFPLTVAGTDTLKTTNNPATFPSFLPSPNGTWDLASIINDTSLQIIKHVPDAVYQFADSTIFQIAGYNYTGYVRSSITSIGMVQYGISIPGRAFDLFPMTSGTYDSIYVDSQIVTYTTPNYKLRFPATYMDSWTSNYYSDFNFHITKEFDTLVYAPGKIRTYKNEIDSVIGWGELRVKDVNGFPSSYFNVLQVQSITYKTDSILMEKAYKNHLIGLVVRVIQGQRDTTCRQLFYRSGEVEPFAIITFKDASFMTPIKLETHLGNMVNALPDINKNREIKLSPNPLSGSSLRVCLPKSGIWTFSITDINGQNVLLKKITLAENTTTIQLPSHLSQGIYLMQCIDDRLNVYSNSLNIER